MTRITSAGLWLAANLIEGTVDSMEWDDEDANQLRAIADRLRREWSQREARRRDRQSQRISS